MNVSPSFFNSRLAPIDSRLSVLWSDLEKQKDENNDLFDAGYTVLYTVFHVVNNRGFYVNVILNKTNNIIVRGKVCNSITLLQSAINAVND